MFFLILFVLDLNVNLIGQGQLCFKLFYIFMMIGSNIVSVFIEYFELLSSIFGERRHRIFFINLLKDPQRKLKILRKKFQVSIFYDFRAVAVRRILYNRNNNTLTYSKCGLKGYILICLKNSTTVY